MAVSTNVLKLVSILLLLVDVSYQACDDPSATAIYFPNGAFVSSDLTSTPNTATFSCNTGYKMGGGTGVVRCNAAGTDWETPTFYCEKDCGIIPDDKMPENSELYMYTGSTIGHTASFVCKPEYSVSTGTEPIIIECLDSGWADTTTTCTPAAVVSACTEAKAQEIDILNGQYVSFDGTTDPKTATYSCNTGYKLAGGTGVNKCKSDDSAFEEPAFYCVKDCGAIPDSKLPDNSILQSLTGTIKGSIGSFVCKKGFSVPAGEAEPILIDCQEIGWSNPATSCIPTAITSECTEAKAQEIDLLNGQYESFDGTSDPKTATFSCNPGYKLEGGTGVIKCKADDSAWEEPTYYCVKDCGVITEDKKPDNSILQTYTGTTLGSIASFRCKEGHTVSTGTEPIVISCENSGWTDTTTTCTPTDCGDFPSDKVPGNTALQAISGTTHGSQAVFACKFGYSAAIGTHEPITIRCENQVWSDTDQHCLPSDCGDIPNDKVPENTVLQAISGTADGSTAAFVCKPGHTVASGSHEPMMIKCVGTVWGITDQHCTISDCGDIPADKVPENTVLQAISGTSHGDTAVFNCKFGYTVVGETHEPIMIRCEGGVWSDSDKQCQPSDCGNILQDKVPENTILQAISGTNHGSTAAFVCKPGFSVAVGSHEPMMIKCEDGVWGVIDQHCIPSDCGHVPAEKMPDNTVLQAMSGTTDGSTVAFDCKRGYTLADGTHEPIMISCQGTVWSDTDRYCIPSDCGNIPENKVPQNTVLQAISGTIHGSAAAFVCKEGYSVAEETHEPIMIKCEDQIWSETAHHCILSDCGDIPTEKVPENTILQAISGTTLGSTAAFVCKEGFSVAEESHEPMMIKCEGQEWGITTQKCIPLDCGNIPEDKVPENAVLQAISGTKHGSTAAFVCKEGFSIAGATHEPIMIKCEGNSWSDSNKHCLVSDCGDIPATKVPKNTVLQAISGTTSGSIAAFGCRQGYIIAEDSKEPIMIKCDGQVWSATNKSCHLSDCGEPPEAPPNSTLRAYTGTTDGSTASYTCHVGHSRSSGKGFITCQNSAWEAVSLICEGQNNGGSRLLMSGISYVLTMLVVQIAVGAAVKMS